MLRHPFLTILFNYVNIFIFSFLTTSIQSNLILTNHCFLIRNVICIIFHDIIIWYYFNRGTSWIWLFFLISIHFQYTWIGNQLKKSSRTPLGTVSSFRDIPFESEEMQKFISYEKQELPLIAIEELVYRSSDIFPDWMTSNLEWRGVKRVVAGSIVDVLSR